MSPKRWSTLTQDNQEEIENFNDLSNLDLLDANATYELSNEEFLAGSKSLKIEGTSMSSFRLAVPRKSWKALRFFVRLSTGATPALRIGVGGVDKIINQRLQWIPVDFFFTDTSPVSMFTFEWQFLGTTEPVFYVDKVLGISQESRSIELSILRRSLSIKNTGIFAKAELGKEPPKIQNYIKSALLGLPDV